jgi:hypothetical protein
MIVAAIVVEPTQDVHRGKEDVAAGDPDGIEERLAGSVQARRALLDEPLQA